MNFQLINGQFNSQEALEIITQLVHVKIRYQENKIQRSSAEEDIKMRESRIKQLQKELYEFKKEIEKNVGLVNIQGAIEVLKNKKNEK
jgi:hypothetical protein